MVHSCSKHPDREGRFYCAKYDAYRCEECLECQDPTLFCKHRTSCLIWECVRHPDSCCPEADQADDLNE